MTEIQRTSISWFTLQMPAVLGLTVAEAMSLELREIYYLQCASRKLESEQSQDLSPLWRWGLLNYVLGIKSPGGAQGDHHLDLLQLLAFPHMRI